MLILCFGSIVPKIGITTTTTNYWTRVVWAIIELINSGSKITAKWLESALNITLESPCNSCANNNNNNINIHTSKIVWHFIRLKVVSCIKIVALFFYSCSQYIYLFCVFPDIYFFSFIRSFVHFFIIFFFFIEIHRFPCLEAESFKRASNVVAQFQCCVFYIYTHDMTN